MYLHYAFAALDCEIATQNTARDRATSRRF